MVTGISKTQEIVRYYVRDKSGSETLVELPIIKAKHGDNWYTIFEFSTETLFVPLDYASPLYPVANLGVKTSQVIFDSIQDYIRWFINSKAKLSEVHMVS